MERAEAEHLQERLAAEHPDRATHSFILSESNGDWTVAKVALPPAATAGTHASKPQPLHDHQPAHMPGGVPNTVGPG